MDHFTVAFILGIFVLSLTLMDYVMLKEGSIRIVTLWVGVLGATVVGLIDYYTHFINPPL